MRILIFLLLFTAFLAFFNMNILTVLRKNRFFRSSPGGKRRGVFGGSAGAEAKGMFTKSISDAAGNLYGGLPGKPGFSGFYGRYKIKLASVLKYSAFDAGAEGLIRLKALLGILGLVVGVLLKNPFLAAVLCVGFFWLPDAYFRVTSLRYMKEADETVETAMSLVTNSYLQNEDIKSSIIENISRVEQPLREVFREFLAETGFVDASIANALHRMKHKAGNAYFSDWCDVLIQCQDDRELKYVLPSIVAKLSGVKRVQLELDASMYDIYKEFLYVVGIVILNMPLIFLINAEWAAILFGTLIGKLAVAVCFSVVFAASAYVVSVNRSLVRMNG